MLKNKINVRILCLKSDFDISLYWILPIKLKTVDLKPKNFYGHVIL